MDMSGYYKKIDGEFVELKQQKESHLYRMDIVEFVIPDVCEVVKCQNNQLKELIIPDGCKRVSCNNNQLKELNILDGCIWVWADMKSITELNKVEELNLWI